LIIPFMFYGIGAMLTLDLSCVKNWRCVVAGYMACIGSFIVCYILLRQLQQLADNETLNERLYLINQQLVM